MLDLSFLLKNRRTRTRENRRRQMVCNLHAGEARSQWGFETAGSPAGKVRASYRCIDVRWLRYRRVIGVSRMDGGVDWEHVRTFEFIVIVNEDALITRCLEGRSGR